jgi:glucose-6-phosphate 1-dehydrogenase
MQPPQRPPVAPFDLVVFGGTGDLAFRKLLPALYLRDRDGQLPNEARIIGAARVAMTDATYREAVRAALLAHLPKEAADKDEMAAFLRRLKFVTLNVLSEGGGWQDLAFVLAPASDRIRIFYLAVAPNLIAPICTRLGSEGMVTELTRVVIEKPIGHDLASAISIGNAIGAVFHERQIFRIDHYLGKGMVQNLMALRFANVLFEPLWNAAHVDHVQITVAETIGLEQRASYYDATGALRDVVQNHVLQLLCLTAMEAPAGSDADAVRDEKLKVLHSLAPMTPENVEANVVRGQYTRGSGAHPVPSYQDEVGAPSTTETFAALKVAIRNWRWADVPFYLRAGKRLKARLSEIVVVFRPIPHSVFDPAVGPIAPNRLIIRVQPDEAVDLWVMITEPRPTGMHLRAVPLDMTFARTFGGATPDAYERLLMDVVRGDQTLFMRRDEVEAAWRWIDPIEAAWAASAKPPLPYAPGSWGPEAAEELLRRDGREWHDPTSE